MKAWGREGASYTGRYPELDAALAGLPAGTILDGELVMVRDSLPEFTVLMQRHASRPRRGPRRLKPIRCVAFDLLYLSGRSLMDKPLVERRWLLHGHLPASPVLSACEGVVGAGNLFFASATAAGHEGVVAKKLSSPYLPRKRSWTKVKQRMQRACAVIGYKAVRGDLRELLMAFVGSVELGVEQDMLPRLQAMHVAKPTVPCRSMSAKWVMPELMGLVHAAGRLVVEFHLHGTSLTAYFLRFLAVGFFAPGLHCGGLVVC